MFSLTWWNVKRARNPAIISIDPLSQTRAQAGVLTCIYASIYLLSASLDLGEHNLDETKLDLFKFKKPLTSNAQENALVASNTTFSSPTFPVPCIVGGSALDTFQVYETTQNRAPPAYVDTPLIAKRYHLIF